MRNVRNRPRLAAAVAAATLASVLGGTASADPIITLVDNLVESAGCQESGGGQAHAIARVEGGSSGTRVEVDITWTHYVDPVQSQTAGCPTTMVTDRSGFCAWRTAYWMRTYCTPPNPEHNSTRGGFECVNSGCGTGNYHELWVEIFPRNPRDSRSTTTCVAYLIGYPGSGTFTTTLTDGGPNTQCTMYRYS